MSQRIIECVPNFSEGRDKAVIRQITAAIEASGGVKLLDVGPRRGDQPHGRDLRRRTRSGRRGRLLPGVKRAAELIDMRRHKGAHPRMGATDVLPLIPIAGVTLAECAELARALARRIADELRIPTYCYEAAAFAPERTKPRRVPRRGVRGAARETGARRRPRPISAARPFDEGVARTGATDRRGARLPDRREFQPEHHLHAPRQRHRLRRARKGPSRPRGQFAHHGQGGEGCRTARSRDAARNASGHEGHRLVHRGVRYRAGLDEHHRHLP